jgi:hypothetical protein
MEYLEGEDLAAWLARRGPVPRVQAVDFLLQAMEAIAEAHVLGIVHRDLKPANFFCVRRADGLLSIKVLDFGISKFTDASSTSSDLSMTTTAAVMGSPLYMSPEQMKSARDVDATTDIWALGVILFQLLTGSTPFDAQSVPELAVQIATTAPRTLSSLLPDAPRSLERVVLRCLQRDRTHRYANVAELAAALVEFGSSTGRISAERIARTIGVAKLANVAFPKDDAFRGQVSTQALEMTPESWIAPLPAANHKRTWFVVSSAVLGMSLVLAILLWKMSTPPAAAESGVVARTVVPVERPNTPVAELTAIPAPALIIEAKPGDRLLDESSESSRSASWGEASDRTGPRRRETAKAAPRGGREKVTIDITNARPGLSIKVDGRPTSYPLRLQRDGKTHEVAFETPNFQPETRRIRADADTTITLENKPGYYVP